MGRGYQSFPFLKSYRRRIFVGHYTFDMWHFLLEISFNVPSERARTVHQFFIGLTNQHSTEVHPHSSSIAVLSPRTYASHKSSLASLLEYLESSCAKFVWCHQTILLKYVLDNDTHRFYVSILKFFCSIFYLSLWQYDQPSFNSVFSFVYLHFLSNYLIWNSVSEKFIQHSSIYCSRWFITFLVRVTVSAPYVRRKHTLIKDLFFHVHGNIWLKIP